MSREPLRLLSVLSHFSGGARLLVASVETVAFWAAIAFPVVYVGGYLATVLQPSVSPPSVPVVVAIIGANVLAVVVGHRHEPSAGGEATDSSPNPAGFGQRET